MANAGEVEIQIKAELDRFERDLRRVESRLGRFDREGTTSFENVDRAANRLNNTGTLLRNTMIALAGAFSIREVTQLSDSFVTANNLLAATAREGETVSATLERIRAIAQDSRAPLEELVMLYNRGSLAANELGASQDELGQFIQVVGRALAIQGSSAQSARGALIQLSQAIGAGTVRAEEFNSILEGALPIAQAVARGIERTGGSVALLRQEIIEGRVSSEEFFDALLSQADEVEEAFRKTTPTIGQSLTVLRNNLVVGLGGATQDAMSGASRAILLIANNLDVAAVAATTFGAAMAVGPASAAARAVMATQAFRAMAVSISLIGPAATASNIALTGLRSTMAFFTGPIGLAIIGVSALGAGVVALNRYTKELESRQNQLNEVIARTADLTNEADQIIARAAGNVEGMGNAAQVSAEQIDGLTGALLAEARAAKTNAINTRMSQMVDIQDELNRATQEYERLTQNTERIQLRGGIVPSGTQQRVEELASRIERLGGQYETIANQIRELNQLDLPDFLDPDSGEASQQAQTVLDALRNRLIITEQTGELERGIATALLQAGLALNDQSEYAQEIRDIVTEIYSIEQSRSAEEERIAQNAEKQRNAKLAILEAEREMQRMQQEAKRGMFEEREETDRGLRDTELGQRQTGPRNELIQLEQARADRMAAIQEAYEAELSLAKGNADAMVEVERQKNERLLALDQNYQQARRAILLDGGAQMFGSLADLARNYAGETSAAYKVLLGISKGFAIADSIIRITQATSQVLADPSKVTLEQKLVSAGIIAAQGAALIGTIASTQAQGFADGGYVSGSGTGRSDSIAARLSNGEFVVNSAATKANRGMLEAINSGSAIAVKTPNVQVYNYATGTKASAEVLSTGDVRIIVREEMSRGVPKIVSGEIAQPNSQVSKALSGALRSTRRRD